MESLSEFDAPLFKKLAHNDTGAADGKQGGFLIPKGLDKYFPDLSIKPSPGPTVDEDIRAALFEDNVQLGVVTTRYQYQTRGGKRKPERRITGNLGPLHDKAIAGDILTIERSVADPDFYRLRLVKAGTATFTALSARVGTRSWGPVDLSNLPVTENAATIAEGEQIAHEAKALQLFDNDAVLTETRSKRVARSRAFQRRVSSIYGNQCAVCGNGLRHVTGLCEVEAAHIVPRGLKGADDARNGLALCRSHHWAFDRGLFGVDDHMELVVPPKVSAIFANTHLTTFSSKPIAAPSIAALRPSPAALSWHWANVVVPHL
jgi:putative restriction endonuclease